MEVFIMETREQVPSETPTKQAKSHQVLKK